MARLDQIVPVGGTFVCGDAPEFPGARVALPATAGQDEIHV